MTPEQTFHDHIRELRNRIAWVVLAIGGGSAIGYVLRTRLINLLQHPLGAPLFYSSPAGSFNFVLRISGAVGVVIALPLIVYQLIRFVEPALPRMLGVRLVLTVIVSSYLLAALGAAFGFFVMVPTSLHFFSGYANNTVKPWISADEYLTYVINVILTFSVLFQIPLLVLFINKIKRIPPKLLLKYQRHIVIGALALAVILPFTYDPISQFIMAVPIVFLYYLSVMLVWLANRKHNRQLKRLPAQVKVPKTLPPTNQPDDPAPTPAAEPKRAKPVERFGAAAWLDANGGLKPADVLKTAVDVLKPGTIAGRPLKLTEQPPKPVHPFNIIELEPYDPMQVHPWNIIDLTEQT